MKLIEKPAAAVVKPAAPKGGKPPSSADIAAKYGLPPNTFSRRQALKGSKGASAHLNTYLTETAYKALAAKVGGTAWIVPVIFDFIAQTLMGAIDDKPLSLSAQERVDGVIRRRIGQLETEFEIKLRREVKRYTEEVIEPMYREENQEAERILKARKGVMTRKDYRKILACLHPDNVTDAAQKERYTECFTLFRTLELLFCDENEVKAAEALAERRQAFAAQFHPSNRKKR